jgi:hypothetical protein
MAQTPRRADPPATIGQRLVVENRTGAAGNVGTLAVDPTVFARTLRARPAEDFAANSLVSETPDALVAHPSRRPPAPPVSWSPIPALVQGG